MKAPACRFTTDNQNNQTVIKERLFLDKANPDALSDEITVIDHALTRPWTVTKRYRRDTDAIRLEYNCSEDNHHVLIGGQDYFLSGDNMLMPSKKGKRRRICAISIQRGNNKRPGRGSRGIGRPGVDEPHHRHL
jgi:hypothetical protein